MAKEWTVPCKICGKPVRYTDRSHRKMQKYGHSRPEYCEKHQKQQKKHRGVMSVSYFQIKLKPDTNISQLQMGPLGMIKHPVRKHLLEEKKSDIDDDKFGVKAENIREIYEWFKDPNHKVVIVIGGTGSGKSTKLVSWLTTPPNGIPEDFFTRFGQILVGQPKQVAASGTAAYSAKISATTLGPGGEIGYTHGGANMADWRNLAVQKTHQQIVNIIERGELKNVGLVMIDEAHERSLEIDSLLRNLKEQLESHPHLRVIIASATIQQEMFRDYFGADTATIVNFEAKRNFTYLNPRTGEVDWADEDEALPYDDLGQLMRQIIPATVKRTAQVVKDIQKGNLGKGDILVFMPGKREVDDTVEQLIRQTRKGEKDKYKVRVLPLYRGLPDKEQDRAIKGKEEPDVIRIVVSTNIAETSVTIESLVYVVDTALAKVPYWDESLGQQKIPVTLISQANAQQRWGRAGRTRNGLVFCMYTKDQFLSLPEYPTPDIQRLNLEGLVMNSRAAGLVDLKEGWIEPPPQEEIDRAVQTLTESKFLDEDRRITDYGWLTHYFSYPSKLVDLFLSSDLYGCSVELATLVPMIQNGGLRRVLIWDKRWSAQTKYEVYRLHRMLMDGCRDDIEFLLKIFSAWEVDPVTQIQRTKAERKAWAERHFVDHDILRKVEQERDNDILSAIYVHKKDPNFRPVDPTLIPRVRAVLLKHFGAEASTPHKTSSGRFEYHSTTEPKDKSLVSYSSIPYSFILPDSTNPWDIYQALQKLNSEGKETGILERIFCDQLLPPFYIYQCQVLQELNDFVQVQVTARSTNPVFVTENQRDEAEEVTDDLEDDEDVDYQWDEEDEETSQVEIGLGEFNFSLFIQIEYPGQYQVGQILNAEIDYFGFFENLSAYAVLRPVVENAFQTFSNHYDVGDEVELTVVQSGIYPEDSKVSLVVREPNSGLILGLDPEDVVFAFAESALGLIPSGASIPATITYINHESRFAKVSLLPYVETQMNSFVSSKADRKGYCTTDARVLEIADDWIYLLLNWSHPNEGLLLVVSARPEDMPTTKTTEVGNEYQVSFGFRTDWESRVKLPELPPEVESILGQRIAANLEWDGRLLTFTGRMTFELFQKLLLVSKDYEYQRAIRKLYWKSNQPKVSKVVDNAVVKIAENLYTIGNMVVVTVESLNNGGAIVDLGNPQVKGFIPRGKIFDGDFAVGRRMRAQVIEFDPSKMEAKLNAKLDENNPVFRTQVGEVFRGEVTGTKEFGIFVRLPSGIDGLVHVSKLGYSRPESFAIGTSLTVRVTKVDTVKKNISLEIVSY